MRCGSSASRPRRARKFEGLRAALTQDALAQYRLALYFRDIGLYRSSIGAADTLMRLSPAKTPSALPAFIAKLLHPTYYADLVLRHAQEYGLDPLLVFSLIRQESLFEPFAVSSAAANGLMQVIPSTGREINSDLSWPPGYTTRRPAEAVRQRALRHALPEQAAQFLQGRSVRRAGGLQRRRGQRADLGGAQRRRSGRVLLFRELRRDAALHPQHRGELTRSITGCTSRESQISVSCVDPLCLAELEPRTCARLRWTPGPDRPPPARDRCRRSRPACAHRKRRSRGWRRCGRSWPAAPASADQWCGQPPATCARAHRWTEMRMPNPHPACQCASCEDLRQQIMIRRSVRHVEVAEQDQRRLVLARLLNQPVDLVARLRLWQLCRHHRRENSSRLA